jgi:hypothetical protein
VSRLERMRGGPVPDGVGRAISEAILNVKHHAYDLFDKGHYALPLATRWWQSLYVHDDGVSYIICDKGMGIPRTMTLNNPLIHPHDAVAVKEAMRRGGTRYGGGSGRGYGSEDIKAPVKQGIASLLILSGGARFEFRNTETEPSAKLIGTNIAGTLVEWHQRFK